MSSCGSIVLSIIMGLLLIGFLVMWTSPSTTQDASDPDPDSDYSVLELTTDAMDDFTQAGKVCVMFYADWCPHCKNMMPNYNAACKRCPGVRFGMLNDTQCRCSGGHCAKYGIGGYPTVLKFTDGEYEVYKGDRTIESLVEFCSA